jgi:hypothetical protein
LVFLPLGAVRDAQLFEGESGELAIGWKRNLGSSYSTVSVDDSRLITAFQAGADDVVAAFDLEHGDELWRQRIGEAYKGHTGSHDGHIATPVLVDDRLYGPGHLPFAFPTRSLGPVGRQPRLIPGAA